MNAAPLKPYKAHRETQALTVFPRSYERGPIEAYTGQGKDEQGLHHFRVHMNAAPLKQPVQPIRTWQAPDFRVHMNAAPLKRDDGGMTIGHKRNFRVHMNAAPLKQKVHLRTAPGFVISAFI